MKNKIKQFITDENKIKSMPIHQLSNIINDNFIINIVKEYGSTNQGIVLMEELNELCTEIIKRKNSNNKNQIAEEIAHCMISFCTYSTAYNFNWDIHKTPDIQIYSESQFILNLLDLQKEISKKLRGKDNDDLLCEKIGLCFSELQKCMYHYVISWNMIREEVSKKVSKYQSIKIKQDLSDTLSVDIERE